jgi:putative PEP-CTERM system histidine kinase
MLSRAGALDEIVDLENDPNPAFSALREQAGLRFLVPLVSLSGLFGIAGIAAPLTTLRLTEEDREIVRLTARQIAGFLALRDADQRLAEARQFDAMHQLTTFLIHDLKTTSSQLSLLVENAERHKHNPEFVDDMLATAANAVERLNRLLHQVRGNGQTNQMVTLTLGELLPDVVASFAGRQPAPILDSYNPDASIYVDRSKLTDALHHLVQNAIDACVLRAREGQDRVTIRSRTDESWLDILIEDTGTGMDQQYIEQKLFAPFETTKGVNGMGVGVFQAREIMRSMGGDLLVHSELDVGTCFTARLPLMGMGRNSG